MAQKSTGFLPRNPNHFASPNRPGESNPPVKITNRHLNLLSVALLLPLCAFAQTAQPLPSAPSAVLAAQNEKLSQPAGDNFVFTPQSTATGPGGTLIEQPQDAALPLSLDDAIALGLERNVRLKYDRANQRADRGYTLGVFNALLPSLTFNAQSSAQELNLAAQGFKPALFAKFASSGLLPPGYKIATIVKVNTTQAQLSLDQVLFNATDIQLYRGTKHESQVVDLNLLADRGALVLIREHRQTALSERVGKLSDPSRQPQGELRDYGIGAQILLDLGIKDMVLLSNTRRTIIGLEGYGLNVVGRRAIEEIP